MTPLLSLNLGVSLFLGIATLASLLFTQSSRATAQRVHQVTGKARQRRGDLNHRATLNGIVERLAQWIRSHITLSRFQDGQLGTRILQAGYRGPLAIDLYTVARIAAPLLSLAIAMVIPFGRLFWIFALPAAMYFAPYLFLEYAIRRRRAAILRSLPDTIDLLVICVDAGLGLDQAILRVAQELLLSHPEIHEELLQINREQRAGKQRLDAWQAMAERVELPEITAFVNMLTQADRFGTPIVRALTTFASGTRLKRTQRAEEAAAKTAIKIIFPLVLFIFPCIFIVLLGPAALTIPHGFSSGF